MQETSVESQEALRRIEFRGKLVQCVTVISLRCARQVKVFQAEETARSAAGSTSAHPKEELQAEMRSF